MKSDMTVAALRRLLNAQPFRPFDVKTTDGDTFRLNHPDFAMISPDETEVLCYDKDNNFRMVDMNHIVSLEPVREHPKKAGKR